MMSEEGSGSACASRAGLERRQNPLGFSGGQVHAGEGAGIHDVTVAVDRTHTGTSIEGDKLS